MTITASEKKNYQDMLDMLTWKLEKEISNYVLEDQEDLLDEDEGYVSRSLKWSRGTKHHQMVINPYGQLRWVEEKTPMNLVVQISNTNLETVYSVLGGV
jgi:hypothetical protein